MRVCRFSKTVSLPQNNSSLIPSRRHGFNFDKPPSKRCLAQLVASSIRKAAPLVINKTEQTQRNPRTREATEQACPHATLIRNPGLQALTIYVTRVAAAFRIPGFSGFQINLYVF